MLLLVVGSATGVAAAVVEAGEGCDEDCGEGDTGCCPLLCPRCVCAARGVTLVVPPTVELPAAECSMLGDAKGEVVAPESADADEILHVPIPAGQRVHETAG